MLDRSRFGIWLLSFGSSAGGLPKPSRRKDVEDHEYARRYDEMRRRGRDEMSVLTRIDDGRHVVLLSVGFRVVNPHVAAPKTSAAEEIILCAYRSVYKKQIRSFEAVGVYRNQPGSHRLDHLVSACLIR